MSEQARIFWRWLTIIAIVLGAVAAYWTIPLLIWGTSDVVVGSLIAVFFFGPLFTTIVIYGVGALWECAGDAADRRARDRAEERAETERLEREVLEWKARCDIEENTEASR